MSFELDIIDDYEREAGLQAAHDQATGFMLDYLACYGSRIPDPIGQWIEVAKKFRNGELDISDLANSRAECWQFMDEPSKESLKAIAGAVLFLLKST